MPVSLGYQMMTKARCLLCLFSHARNEVKLSERRMFLFGNTGRIINLECPQLLSTISKSDIPLIFLKNDLRLDNRSSFCSKTCGSICFQFYSALHLHFLRALTSFCQISVKERLARSLFWLALTLPRSESQLMLVHYCTVNFVTNLELFAITHTIFCRFSMP